VTRERRGLSISELARLAGMHASNLSAIESGAREPTVGLLIRLAQALDVRLNDLVDVEDLGPGEKYISRCGDFVKVTPEGASEG
jgi:transcriptional regulator with XRE-family HTH domain